MRNDNSGLLPSDLNFMKEMENTFFFYLQKPSAEAAQQD